MLTLAVAFTPLGGCSSSNNGSANGGTGGGGRGGAGGVAGVGGHGGTGGVAGAAGAGTAGVGGLGGTGGGAAGSGVTGTGGQTDGGTADGGNPNQPVLGNATNGQTVFRFETFGNEGFWTDAVKLPQGIVAANLTPVQALQAGLSVDSDAVVAAFPAATVATIVAELATDLSPANAPTLNSPATTIALINANAVIGLVPKDSNGDGKIDVTMGDKVGVTCAICHSITDHALFNLPAGGSIGKRIDGPAVHTINVGAAFALAANSRALYPTLQLKQPDGSTIGRDPTFAGLTKDSTEAEVDAYLNDPVKYPIGMFDDTFDGNGNPMHNTPMFRADLGAPWGTTGEFSKLDQFANTVYTALLDMTNLTTTGGKAFVHKVAGAAGDAMIADYVTVLAATGVTNYPYVKAGTATTPGDPNGVLGLRVDNTKLIDLNAYLTSLPAPAGKAGAADAIARGKAVFETPGRCIQCHNADQSVMVPSNVLPMALVWPGDNPTILAQRDPPLSPVENTPGNTFDDKHIVINASLRGLVRGEALPLLLDLARKPVFLHDNSVPTLDNLLDPARGGDAPHPFYLSDAASRSDMTAYLISLDTTSKP
jgi:cytochrome c2